MTTQQIACFGYLIVFFVIATTEAVWSLLPNLQLFPISGLIFAVLVLARRGDRAAELSRDPAAEVSVVIPTIGRASLRTAVESALHQTSPPLEVIVVLDRDCEPDLPASPAIRVVRTSGGVGPSQAKHIGVESARGNVIALLDDDDVWHLDKLEMQLAAAPPGDEWIVSSRFRTHVEGREPVVGPRTLIDPHERVASYLFEFRTRRAFNMVPTSTMVFPRVRRRRCRCRWPPARFTTTRPG